MVDQYFWGLFQNYIHLKISWDLYLSDVGVLTPSYKSFNLHDITKFQ
jgi:hypothetical protein